MTIPMLDLNKEYSSIKSEIDAAITNCLASHNWILGPEVKTLESEVASFLNCEFCTGTSSGTEALLLALRAMSLCRNGEEYFNRQSEVLVPSITFTATGDVVLRSGATPVFIDIDPETFFIDLKKVEAYLQTNSNVTGIICVHLYGQSGDVEKLREITDRFGVFLIEDVAQAFGGEFGGKKLGTIGHVGAFSFFPSKNLGAYGDAGLVCTDESEVSETINLLIKHGGKDKYNVEHIGYNARLDTIQAAVLSVKLKYIDQWNQKRREIALLYNEGLAGLKSVSLPKVQSGGYHVYHQYTIKLESAVREDLKNFLTKQSIASMVYYPVPLHKMKVFENRSIRGSDLFESEQASQQVLSLPIGPFLEITEARTVVSAIVDFMDQV